MHLSTKGHRSVLGGVPDWRHIKVRLSPQQQHPGSHSTLRDHCGEFEESMIRTFIVFVRLGLHKVELELEDSYILN